MTDETQEPTTTPAERPPQALCSALRDNYEKERQNYWAEPCDTCVQRHKRPYNPRCQSCTHYSRRDAEHKVSGGSKRQPRKEQNQ